MFTSQCVSQKISICAKSVEHPGVNGLRMFKFGSEDAVVTLRLSVSPCSLQRTTTRQSSNRFCLGQITFNTNFNPPSFLQSLH